MPSKQDILQDVQYRIRIRAVLACVSRGEVCATISKRWITCPVFLSDDPIYIVCDVTGMSPVAAASEFSLYDIVS